MDFAAIFVTGFVILGIYKVFELFVRRKERLAIIEKLASLANPESTGSIRLPNILFEKQDYGLWPLRISLLLIGIGLGCLSAFFIRMMYIDMLKWDQISMINAACICFFGGLGLFIAFLIELKQKNNPTNRDNN